MNVLTFSDVDRLVAVCSQKAPSGIRDAALMMVLYRTSLRASKVLALLPDSINPDYINPWLECWLQKRSELCISHTRPLFCTITKGRIGKPIIRQAVDAMLKRRARKAGIDKVINVSALSRSRDVRSALLKDLPKNIPMFFSFCLDIQAKQQEEQQWLQQSKTLLKKFRKEIRNRRKGQPSTSLNEELPQARTSPD